MPQKAFEWYIFHVMAYAAYDMHIFWNAPNSNSISFSLFSVRNLIAWKFRNAPIINFHSEFHFKILTRDEISNRKGRETETVRNWGISKKYASAITWKYVFHTLFWAFHITSLILWLFYLPIIIHTSWLTKFLR